jgi:hypothetical protein
VAWLKADVEIDSKAHTNRKSLERLIGAFHNDIFNLLP